MKITIKGVITDAATGDPLIGATISSNQDKFNGTTADYDGNFTISVVPSDILTVSYLGYKARTLSASSLQGGIALVEDGFTTDEIIIKANPKPAATINTSAIKKAPNYLLIGGITAGVLALGYFAFANSKGLKGTTAHVIL